MGQIIVTCCGCKTKKIEKLLLEIVELLYNKFKPVDTKFVVGEKEKGNINMNVGEKQPYIVFEIDVNGQNVNPSAGDTVTVVSSDETVVSVAPDTTVAPGSLTSGFALGLKAGNAVLTASGFNAAGKAIGTPKSITVDVIEVNFPATDISFTLGVPEPQ